MLPIRQQCRRIAHNHRNQIRLQLFHKFFRQAFTLEIDGDNLPADNAQELLDQLQQLFARYHAAEALKVKEGIKPVPDFHTVRHTALTPAQNLALNQLCPIIAMIKTKARPKEGA